jgi:LmbE family N-acetylglucosaminyl deacetylase
LSTWLRESVEKLRGYAIIEIENVVIVVAHPDDEILWFSSILEQCKRVLVCYGPSATSRESWDAGRAKLMDSYPLTKVRFLKLRQAGGFDAANWNNPKEADSGLQIRGRTGAAYERNAEELLRILKAELEHEPLVFTHNPWGEYGHEEHVQVFRVLTRLKDTLGFDLFVNSYVSNRSVKLMSRRMHLLADDSLTRETDRALARRLKDIYSENNCWTWAPDYEWPAYESFYRIIQPDDRDESATSASLPLNYITRNYNLNPIRKNAKKLLPKSVKSCIKKNV